MSFSLISLTYKLEHAGVPISVRKVTGTKYFNIWFEGIKATLCFDDGFYKYNNRKNIQEFVPQLVEDNIYNVSAELYLTYDEVNDIYNEKFQSLSFESDGTYLKLAAIHYEPEYPYNFERIFCNIILSRMFPISIDRAHMNSRIRDVDRWLARHYKWETVNGLRVYKRAKKPIGIIYK